MKQLRSIIIKETLLIMKDKAGLGILFIMPVAFILIMSIVQDSAFKSITDAGLPVIVVNNDNDSLGTYLIRGLEQTEFCQLSTTINGKIPTAEEAHEAVAQGDFMFGIIIPPRATKKIRDNVELLISSTLTDTVLTIDKGEKQVEIVIYFDPATKRSLVSTISSKMQEFISNLRSKIMFETFAEQIKEFIPGNNTPLTFESTDIIAFKEEYAAGENSQIIPNSVQHNVPAWTIFGMFFIVVPLAGSIIKEKQEGSTIRLKTLPGPYVYNHLGKLTVYTGVCLIQFVLMMFFGRTVLPLLDLPVLQFGNQLPAIAVMAVFLALASTSFGMFIGTLSSTYQQAAIGGSLTILILAAVGGIWVPMHIMPDYMQTVSKVSPLNWGMEAFYLIFLRGKAFPQIFPYLASLGVFFVFNIFLTTLILRYKTEQ